MRLIALRGVGRWFDILLCQRDRAALQIRNEILGKDPSRAALIAVPINRAHRIDIALPDCKQLLDVGRFGQRFAKHRNEFISPIETLARAPG